MHPSQHKSRTKNKGGGSFTSEEWEVLCAQFDHRCVACGRRDPLVVDHVRPIIFNGSSSIENIQPLCMRCNNKKRGNYMDFRRMLFEPERNGARWAARKVVGYEEGQDERGFYYERAIYADE